MSARETAIASNMYLPRYLLADLIAWLVVAILLCFLRREREKEKLMSVTHIIILNAIDMRLSTAKIAKAGTSERSISFIASIAAVADIPSIAVMADNFSFTPDRPYVENNKVARLGMM